ncbi:MAG: amino acid adenylation domain-containing protein, partial [Gemmatimonadaceae bacterium]
AFIDELFAEQAVRRPEAIAVECNGVSLTYAQLDARASVLAARIISAGVLPDEAVVLFADRSLEFVVACLAIVKAGATYLPIEPGYPKDRLLYMIADANARVVVAANDLLEQITVFVADAPTEMRVLGIDANADDVTQPIREHVKSATSAASRVAYIMYTSGSSGQPKGVAVPHRGVVRLVRNTTYMNFTPDDAMLCLATTMFDLSTWEIWSALLNGGRLVLLPAGPPDPAVIANLIESAGVTMMWNTPALFQQLVDFGLKQYKTVRLFAIAGDIVPVPHLRRAVAALPECQFVNGYGPTENSVFTCAYPVPMNLPVEDPLPIGPPLSNTQAYVLDAHGTPTPVGVAGELFTGGDGVAVGYVKRPELTAERFVHDPFSTQPNATMYRTGDAARWRADGVVEFLGRLDNQVKIRGYRIEPGEVESVMCALPGVRTAAVAVRKDSSGQKRLLGYYVVEDNKKISPADVRTALRGLLPDYMIPAAITLLDELPQTNSGKIDRKALPEPTNESTGDADVNFRSRPLGRSQRQIALIWEELLNHRPIGADDDFFEIGGHSLLATRMIAEVERVLGRRLPLATLLEKPTIRHLAQRVDLELLEDPEPSTVVLNAEGKARPFVFVHGDLTGGGWYCRKLSTLIGSDTPLIVLPTFRPPESGDPLTIEQMASMHVKELRKVQPAGPYRVGGFCAGGLIALGIAHQLTEMGEKVEQLVLVDSVNKNAPVSRWRAVIDRIAPPSETRDGFVKRQNTMNKAQYYDARLRAVGAMGPQKFARWALNAVFIRLPGGRSRAATEPNAADIQRPKPVKSFRAQREKLLFY